MLIAGGLVPSNRYSLPRNNSQSNYYTLSQNPQLGVIDAINNPPENAENQSGEIEMSVKSRSNRNSLSHISFSGKLRVIRPLSPSRVTKQ